MKNMLAVIAVCSVFLCSMSGAEEKTRPVMPVILNQDAVDTLVAGVALYPDEVVKVILAATKHPVALLRAARPARSGPFARRFQPVMSEAVRTLKNEYPQTLATMAEHPAMVVLLGLLYRRAPELIWQSIGRVRARIEEQAERLRNNREKDQQAGKDDENTGDKGQNNDDPGKDDNEEEDAKQNGNTQASTSGQSSTTGTCYNYATAAVVKALLADEAVDSLVSAINQVAASQNAENLSVTVNTSGSDTGTTSATGTSDTGSTTSPSGTATGTTSSSSTATSTASPTSVPANSAVVQVGNAAAAGGTGSSSTTITTPNGQTVAVDKSGGAVTVTNGNTSVAAVGGIADHQPCTAPAGIRPGQPCSRACRDLNQA